MNCSVILKPLKSRKIIFLFNISKFGDANCFKRTFFFFVLNHVLFCVFRIENSSPVLAPDILNYLKVKRNAIKYGLRFRPESTHEGFLVDQEAVREAVELQTWKT